MRAEEIIKEYNLEPHPEGGYFVETYESKDCFDFYLGNRPYCGSIYFLLNKNDISHFHKIDSEEIWFYHEGRGLIIHMIDHDGNYSTKLLGMNKKDGESPMVIVPKGYIFASENIDKNEYTFVSCVTTPRFLYSEFKLIKYEEVNNSNIRKELFID